MKRRAPTSLAPQRSDLSSPRRRAIAAFVGRIDAASAAEEIARALRDELPGYARLSEVELGHQIGEFARPITASFARFVHDGGDLPEELLARIREAAKVRVAEGVPLNDILRAYRLGARMGWQLLADQARPDEESLLAPAANLLMEFLDHLSTAEASAYIEEEERLRTEEGHRLRLLVEGLAKDAPLDADLQALAERLGFPLGENEYRPFALAIFGASAREHSKAARELVGKGLLAVEEQRSVAGLLPPGAVLPDGVGEGELLALGPAMERRSLADGLEEVRLLLDIALRQGLTGQVELGSFLPELLLARSPALAEKVRGKVLEPLEQIPDQRGELLKTLATYVCRPIDRRASAEELHVHPNTLDNRLRRVEEIVGLDLKTPSDLALAVLAIKQDQLRSAARGVE